MCKMMISPGIFSFLFLILIFWVVEEEWWGRGEGGGERAKNSPEVKIRIKSIIVYQEQCSIS